MMKAVKYFVIILTISFLGYHSIYFKKLSLVNKDATQKFDAAAFSKKLWEEKFPAKMDSAVDLSVLIQSVKTDKESALRKYTNALGIGNYRYAFIKSNATVTEVNEDEVFVQINMADSIVHAVIATEYIYGNAIRDASSLVEITNFPNSSDLNSISEELNKIVKNTIVPDLRKKVVKGARIQITGAVEINKEYIKWNGLEILPLKMVMEQ